MIILGLHFGHDASISIIKDGNVLLCFERERLCRIKHAISLHPDDITRCLDDVGISIKDIDYCTLTSTQDFEYIFLDFDKLHITLEHHEKHTLPCTMTDKLHVSPAEMFKSSSGSLRDIFNHPDHRFRQYHKLLPGGEKLIELSQNVLPSFDKFVHYEIWQNRKLSDIASTDYSAFMTDDIRLGFHYPATLYFLGQRIPAYLFAHHYAHACYAFYESPYTEAAILSHDGGESGKGYDSGFFAYGNKNKVYLYSPHNLSIGDIYTEAASTVGFGVIEGPGKLMGLAAYGKPALFADKFVGNLNDIQGLPPNAWTMHCVEAAHQLGYDLSSLGNVNKILESINIDIAASTQKLIEETMMKATYALYSSLISSNLKVRHLCLSGGVALNCPSNTKIANDNIFDSLFVPPAASDSGLSIGSALALYYNIMEHNRSDIKGISTKKAYQGLQVSSKQCMLDQAFGKFEDKICIDKCSDVSDEAAECLFKNNIIGWFQLRSEIGHRALGHRSILANPTYLDNWTKVNAIKQREAWRPLAPSVLESELKNYFAEVPLHSYFMLLNGKVITSTVPAITHVDGSARVQCVNVECDEFYHLIRKFSYLSGIPVILNTSFNGPGAPIVETPQHAIEFLLNSEIDHIFINNYKVARADRKDYLK